MPPIYATWCSRLPDDHLSLNLDLAAAPRTGQHRENSRLHQQVSVVLWNGHPTQGCHGEALLNQTPQPLRTKTRRRKLSILRCKSVLLFCDDVFVSEGTASKQIIAATAHCPQRSPSIARACLSYGSSTRIGFHRRTRNTWFRLEHHKLPFFDRQWIETKPSAAETHALLGTSRRHRKLSTRWQG